MAESVDTALTRIESENRKQLRINYLQFLVVPRTGLEPARLAALAPETSASTIPPPGHCDCKDTSCFSIFKMYLCSFSNVFPKVYECFPKKSVFDVEYDGRDYAHILDIGRVWVAVFD